MWIPSKLSCPSYAITLLERTRLESMLEALPAQKLIFIRAPAGYGKTCLASQWLATKRHLGWYSIDSNDNDPHRFACYFIAALNNACHQACSSALKLAEQSGQTDILVLITEALKQIAKHKQACYLVLDDYHHIDHQAIHQALSYFIQRKPDNLSLVITSRSTPRLGIARLRVQGLVCELDQQSLAFSHEETQAFLTMRLEHEIDASSARKLYQEVEGWPSALELIAWQAIQPSQEFTPNRSLDLTLNQSHLCDYLLDEVFTHLEPEMQNFLLKCSILDKFNHTLASVVTGRSDAQNMIENLQRLGLFIQPVENQHNWYRFHRLFNQFLAHERHHYLADQETQLHCAAVQAWLGQGSAEQALRHAELAERPSLSVDILKQHGWELFNSGKLALLQHVLSQLDSHTVYQHATLCLLHAWIAHNQQRNEDVDLILLQADASNMTLNHSEQGEFNALKAQITIQKNQPERALELAELALSQMDGRAFHSRIVATSVIGEVNHVLGFLDRALPLMQQTEKLARQYQVPHQALWAMVQQSEILLAKGYLQAAFDVQESGFKLIDDQLMQHDPLQECLLRVRAQVLFSWNRLEEAQTCAQNAIKLLSDMPEKLHIHSYAMLCRIALCRGEEQKAGKYAAQIELLLASGFHHMDATSNAEMALLIYWQTKQETSAIKLWLENAAPLTNARNHFSQLHGRNIVRAQLVLGKFADAVSTINKLGIDAQHYHLLADQCRNAILATQLCLHQQNSSQQIHQQLQYALQLANQTSMMGDFLFGINSLTPILLHADFQSSLDDLTRYRVNQLIKSVNVSQRSQAKHFDQGFIDQLIHHPQVPELVRNSPLTQREWQVLGLIYAGLTNEQIAHELDVAATTIKTHIRNLYQKLNIANRKQAVATAESLIKIVAG
ncbi:HTH-type transcriptional regulator MalT [Vibrio rhodolitus]|uniref:HTH-type transcriptional regulator MalT n=1 Tax=Vibrio rhodolitus TaxID=2231649 RepID=UPI000E0A372D|nr:HTH-type transcriptional regulator MalT [Vibrio rhodolitus]